MNAFEPGPGGNVYDKYGSRNPVVRLLMAGFFRDLDALFARARPRTMIDAGCGEGIISARYAPRLDALTAFDVDAACVATARARLSSFAATKAVFQADLTDAAVTLPAADVVMCCEVLEHVPDPEAALARLATLTRRHLIVSVPREPLWRGLNMARLKYLTSLGNTPGHIQHWSRRGFRTLVSGCFQVVETRTPLPWTMVLARKIEA